MGSLIRIAFALLVAAASPHSISAEEPAMGASAPAGRDATKPLPVTLAYVQKNTVVAVGFSSSCFTEDSKRIPAGSAIVVVRKAECTRRGVSIDTGRYEILYKGETYFIEPWRILMFEYMKDAIAAYSPEQVEASLDVWKAASLKATTDEFEGARKALLATKKYGVALLRSTVYDVSEHTSGTGARFVVGNTGEKTIKYVTVNFVGLNAVNDPVPTGRGPATIRGIGPIEPGNTGSYSRDYVWATDTVHSHRVSSILVEYMDGSKRTINDIKSIALKPVQGDIVLNEE